MAAELLVYVQRLVLGRCGSGSSGRYSVSATRRQTGGCFTARQSRNQTRTPGIRTCEKINNLTQRREGAKTRNDSRLVFFAGLASLRLCVNCFCFLPIFSQLLLPVPEHGLEGRGTKFVRRTKILANGSAGRKQLSVPVLGRRQFENEAGPAPDNDFRRSKPECVRKKQSGVRSGVQRAEGRVHCEK